MTDLPRLAIFALATLIRTPGPDMMYVAARSVGKAAVRASSPRWASALGDSSNEILSAVGLLVLPGALRGRGLASRGNPSPTHARAAGGVSVLRQTRRKNIPTQSGLFAQAGGPKKCPEIPLH